MILTFKIHPKLEINMIDVGQGDGILISCNGRNMLIDGGSTSKKNVGKYQIIPFLKYKGIGKLDAVVMTHEDQDHVSGILEILEDMDNGGIRVKMMILPEISDGSKGDNYHKLEIKAYELRIPILYINIGESFSMGNAMFTCLNPELNMETDGANEYSTVLFMEYVDESKSIQSNICKKRLKRKMHCHDDCFYIGDTQFTALFTGDVEGEGLETVKEQLKKKKVVRKKVEGAMDKEGVTLLKVAHHGSMYTTDEEFLSLTKPKVAIISCGVDNSYGHPHKELLERLENTDATVYRTDESGCITVELLDRAVKVWEFWGSGNK